MTTQKILVVGSVAYDYVMKYDHLFSNVLLPEKLAELSVTFPVVTQSLHMGGCGGNIIYNLKLLGVEALLLGVGGKDFEKYFAWLEKNKIDSSGIFVNQDVYTASAYIMTDKAEHQITIFHIGAMGSSPEALSVKDFPPEQTQWVIVSPDDHRRMLRVSKECRQNQIRYIFDPGQQIGQLSAEELKEGISGATILIVNEYEGELLTQRLKISKEELETMASNYIETRGAKECYIRTPEGKFFIPTVKPKEIVDPTGCGDAFRAGVLAGLDKGYSLEKACKIGALTATYALEHEGTQEHFFTLEEFEKRFEENYGEKFNLAFEAVEKEKF